MSTTLFFLVPIGMLAVVWSLCFVGACFPTSGEGPGTATPYSNLILGESGLLAYWPLSDAQGSTQAKDLTGNGHDGTYTIPPDYPAAPANSRVLNPPTANLGQGSIVPGDTGTGDLNLKPASVDFEGGYVSIPWAANSPQLKNFTIEAWVKPNWTEAETGFLWAVFGAITPTAGFVLYINDNNNWVIAIGDGTTNNPIDTMVPAALKPSASTPAPITYVAMTFGADNFLRLWINPQFGPGPDTSNPMPTPPNATWTSPNTVVYAAVDPTQQPLTFFIGAGYNDQPVRTQAGVTGAPLYPFQGQIQSVALYQAALDPSDLATHFNNGSAP
jgi:hypothetical protein